MSTQTIDPILGWDEVFMVLTQDGSNTLFSRAFQTTYHSIFGAVGESKHVFLQNGLLTQADRASISILEFGFGTGLNAFLSYLFSIKHQKEVHFTGIEAFPLDVKVAEKLDYPGYLATPEERDIYLRMHRDNDWIEDLFHFNTISSFDLVDGATKFDCIFFDAFAPDHHSEIWEQPVFDRLFYLTSDGGCLVTYSARGEVRRRMINAGYNVERLPGPPGKREMLRAVRKA